MSSWRGWPKANRYSARSSFNRARRTWSLLSGYGSTWRSMLGLESSRDVFRRYKQMRAAERDYLGEAGRPSQAKAGRASALPNRLQSMSK